MRANSVPLVGELAYGEAMRTAIGRAVAIGTVLGLILGISTPVSSAASWIQYQSSPVDSYNRPDLPAAYDITQVDFGVPDADPSRYSFFLDFAEPITASLFADGLGSWAGILIDINGDGKDDYSLETDTTVPYNGNYYHAGRLLDRTGASPVNSSLCEVRTWTNLDTQATWIGFSIPKTCLPFGPTVSIQGYSDHNSNDNAEFDYAPNSYWTLNLSGGTITPITGNSSSSNSSTDLPSVSTTGVSEIASPSNPPDNLVSLATTVSPSVVTVLCGNSLGSGWSINTQLSNSLKSAGYKSYIITNHHVIADCTIDRNITLILADQTKIPAYVWSWDQANDVAGIATGTYIPPLNWRGPTPQQGWWVGVIGSPLGFPGILTTGIVSSVNSPPFSGTTTAPINHGNSGGPVFDRTGRVLGLATANYVDTQGFGIFNGSPLLCGKIINCASTDQVWGGALVQPLVKSCRNAPNPPKVSTSYPGPIFTVTPSISGESTTGVKWSASYFNPSSQVWSVPSAYKLEMLTGAVFKYQVPLIEGSDLNIADVSFYVVAVNDCGDSEPGYAGNASGGVSIRLPPDYVTSYAQNASFPLSQVRVGLSTLVVSSATLPMDVSDISEGVCTYSASNGVSWIFFLSAGTCSFTVKTDGSDTRGPSSLVQVSFKITKPNSSPITISCAKGKTIKRISGLKPICPTGFKKK